VLAGNPLRHTGESEQTVVVRIACRAMSSDDDLLRRIDRYLDTVPRAVTRTETIGPFTVFINEGRGWRYYARPTPGETAFTVDDARGVLARQRDLGQPTEFEWVEGSAPTLGDTLRSAGLVVESMPLMHVTPQTFRAATSSTDAVVRFARIDDDLARWNAVAMVAFDVGGTEPGPEGVETLDPMAADADPGSIGFARERLAEGFTVMAGALVAGDPVSIGSHQPLEGVAEVTGVATLPAFRRRGLGAAVTSLLVRDAFDRGVTTVFLSAGDDDVARMYASLGFREVGRVGQAHTPAGRHEATT
jgi:ribosomal protein S18 acetylase RimI-like enzyme